MTEIIKVVAGVLFHMDKVLITSRPASKSYPDYWEFPGGKLELNETNKQALVRELNEEIGVVVALNDIFHLMHIRQLYPTAHVHLDVMLITNWQLEPQPLEQQQLYWQPIKQPCTLTPILPTTEKILTILQEF
jgi:8-oxo-dGTP diphosphatase